MCLQYAAGAAKFNHLENLILLETENDSMSSAIIIIILTCYLSYHGTPEFPEYFLPGSGCIIIVLLVLGYIALWRNKKIYQAIQELKLAFLTSMTRFRGFSFGYIIFLSTIVIL